MSVLQRDLYDDTIFYYDWHGDLWNLGDLRDTLAEGDTFEADGKTWFILGRSNISQSFTIQEEPIFSKGKSEAMRKQKAKENMEHWLRELLKSKDDVSMCNVIHIDGHLYEDVVKDIETYLEIFKETD
jgi:hypothetical protein